MNYTDNYKYLIINIITYNDSHVAQKLLFDHCIDWDLGTLEDSMHLYDDKNCFYCCDLVNKNINLFEKIYDIKNTKYYSFSNKSIYNISSSRDIIFIKQILKYGQIIPTYNPKKIERII